MTKMYVLEMGERSIMGSDLLKCITALALEVDKVSYFSVQVIPLPTSFNQELMEACNDSFDDAPVVVQPVNNTC